MIGYRLLVQGEHQSRARKQAAGRSMATERVHTRAGVLPKLTLPPGQAPVLSNDGRNGHRVTLHLFQMSKLQCAGLPAL